MTTTSKKGKIISGETRTVILRVLSFFEAEKKHKSNFIPVSQVIRRTSLATGVSRGTLANIKHEAKALSKNNSLSPMDIELPTPIRIGRPGKRLVFSKSELNTLREIIERFETPSLRKILEVSKRELNYKGGLSSLRLILYNELGLKFAPTKQNKLQYKKKPENNHPEEEIPKVKLESDHEKDKPNEPMDMVEVVKNHPEEEIPKVKLESDHEKDKSNEPMDMVEVVMKQIDDNDMC